MFDDLSGRLRDEPDAEAPCAIPLRVPPRPVRTRHPLSPATRSRVLRYIDENLDQSLSITELAAVAHVSTGHFCRSFKAIYGVPAHLYITRLRLARALDLISRTKMPLCEVAITCGFCDQSHLCRLFRKAYGGTPSDCRRGRFRPLPLFARTAEA